MSARESCPLLKCVSPVGCRVFGCYELLKMAEAARPSHNAELAALKAEIIALRAERDAALAEGAVIGRMNAMKDAEAEIGRLRKELADALSLAAAAIIDQSPVTEDQTRRTAELIAQNGHPAALEPKP